MPPLVSVIDASPLGVLVLSDTKRKEGRKRAAMTFAVLTFSGPTWGGAAGGGGGHHARKRVICARGNSSRVKFFCEEEIFPTARAICSTDPRSCG